MKILKKTSGFFLPEPVRMLAWNDSGEGEAPDVGPKGIPFGAISWYHPSKCTAVSKHCTGRLHPKGISSLRSGHHGPSGLAMTYSELLCIIKVYF